MAGRILADGSLVARGRCRPGGAAGRLVLLTLAALAVLLVWAALALAAPVARRAVVVERLGAATPEPLGAAAWTPLSSLPHASRPPVTAHAGAPVTIFSDGFEGDLSAWSVTGTPTWAAYQYGAASGQWAAYCAGSTIAPPGPYANNMDAWLDAGPFDLSALQSGTFAYKLKYITQAEKDWVIVSVSVDGQSYYGYKYFGTSNGWVSDSIDLTNVPTLGNVCGKSQVRIAFHFVSDPSIVYEGAYVDEVSVTGVGSGGGGQQQESGLVLTADTDVVPYNGSVTLTGALLNAASGFLIPGKSVGLFWSQEDKIDGQWNFAGAAQSDTGDYSVTASGIKRLTYFAMFFDGDSEYLSSMSNLVKVKARAKITPPAVPKVVASGPKVWGWGTILPRHSTAQNRASHTKVYLERYYSGSWHAVTSLYAQKYRNTKTATEYGIGLHYKPGSWRIMAVHEDDDHAKTASSWRTFTVY